MTHLLGARRPVGSSPVGMYPSCDDARAEDIGATPHLRGGRLGAGHPGRHGGQWPNVSQLTLTKSAGWPLVKVRYTSWVPVTAEMFAGTVRQLCQPPVFAIAKLPTG